MTYCALPVTVTMESIPARVAGALDDVERYLSSRGIEITGPSLIRYRFVSEVVPFSIEVGWLIDAEIWIDAPFMADVLPEGAYAMLTHEGPYSQLGVDTGTLLAWGEREGVNFDVKRADAGDVWTCWYEVYVDDPVDGPEGLGGPVEICLLTVG
jgi:hypothetical protein